MQLTVQVSNINRQYEFIRLAGQHAVNHLPFVKQVGVSNADGTKSDATIRLAPMMKLGPIRMLLPNKKLTNNPAGTIILFIIARVPASTYNVAP